MVDFNVGVVIAGAGSGTRLGGAIPKQYCKILDKPLMFFALEAFLDIKWITRVALVVDNVEKVRAMLQEHSTASGLGRVTVIKGEESRHRSIKAGMSELHKQYPGELQVVIVHDAVRPLLPSELVRELTLAAAECGAAGAVRPLVSTVLRAEDGFMGESLDRSKHVASETPQAFQFNVLYSSYNKCTDEELDHGTECLQVVHRHANITAKLIPGPDDLWKVTHPKDMLLAMATIKRMQTAVCIIAGREISLGVQLVEYLRSVARTVRHITSAEDATDTVPNTYNTVIVFHEREIQQDTHLVDFASVLDTDNLGLIVHVIQNASVEGMQSMSVYSLQRAGRSMAHNYDKLRKGVVIIHCVSGSEEQQLIDLICTLPELMLNVRVGSELSLGVTVRARLRGRQAVTRTDLRAIRVQAALLADRIRTWNTRLHN